MPGSPASPTVLRGPVFRTPGQGPDLVSPPGTLIRDADAAAVVAVATPVADLTRQVVSGCVVGPSSPAAMTVDVTDGLVTYDGAHVIVSAATGLAVAAADPSLDRYDAVVIDSTGAASVVTGTAGNAWNPGSIDASKVVAGVFKVAAAATSVTATADDVRVTPQRVQQINLPQLQLANTMTFSFLSGAQSASDPGTGNVGFDNAIFTSVAHIYLNYLSPSWPFSGKYKTLKAWLQPLGTPSSSAAYYLRAWSRKEPNKIHTFKVTGFTDHGGWADLAVTPVTQVQEDVGGVSGSPHLSTDAADTILEFNGAAASTSPTSTNGETTLAADTNITPINTFVDGPNTGSIGASGQALLVMATVTVVGPITAPSKITVRLWDGTTVFAEAEVTVTASPAIGQVELKAIINPSAAATYKVSCATTAIGAGAPVMKAQAVDNSIGGAVHVATKIMWVRLA